jgi:hypothetical protein
MKKIALILAMLMLLMLCACQNDKPDAPTTPSTQPSEPTQPSLNIPTDPTTKPIEDGKITYTVTVLDQNGDPVVGAKLQICDDNGCKLMTTGENGVAQSSYKESNYHITILKLPAGYESDGTEFYFEEDNTLTITVTKS